MATTVTANSIATATGVNTDDLTYNVAANTFAILIVHARENNASGDYITCNISGVSGFALLEEVSDELTESIYTDYRYHGAWAKWYSSSDSSETVTVTYNKTVDRTVMQLIEVVFDNAVVPDVALESNFNTSLNQNITYGDAPGGVAILSVALVDPYTVAGSLTMPTFAGYTELLDVTYNQSTSIADALWTGYAIDVDGVSGDTVSFTTSPTDVGFADSVFVISITDPEALGGMLAFSF